MKIPFRRFLSLIVVTTSSVYGGPLTADALTFEFTFDDDADSEVTPPLVGSGQFRFDGDPGDGSFVLDTLVNPLFSAAFGGDTFELGDSEDPLSDVLAVIFTSGANRLLRFGNIHGGSGGQTNGAVDFINESNQLQKVLSFEPGVDGGERYGSTTYFGDYLAVAVVPEPSAVIIFATGLLIATLGRRREFSRKGRRRSFPWNLDLQ